MKLTAGAESLNEDPNERTVKKEEKVRVNPVDTKFSTLIRCCVTKHALSFHFLFCDRLVAPPIHNVSSLVR